MFSFHLSSESEAWESWCKASQFKLTRVSLHCPRSLRPRGAATNTLHLPWNLSVMKPLRTSTETSFLSPAKSVEPKSPPSVTHLFQSCPNHPFWSFLCLLAQRTQFSSRTINQTDGKKSAAGKKRGNKRKRKQCISMRKERRGQEISWDGSGARKAPLWSIRRNLHTKMFVAKI